MRLVGLIVGAAVILGLALFVVDKVNEPGESPAAKAGLDVSAAPAPVSDAGRSAACDQSAREINTAEQAYHTRFGFYADVPTLLQAGNLASTPSGYTAESSDGWVTYRLVGRGGCP